MLLIQALTICYLVVAIYQGCDADFKPRSSAILSQGQQPGPNPPVEPPNPPPKNYTEEFEVIGTTDADGFMSFAEYNSRLYAGTYSIDGSKVKIYSYPPWRQEAHLDAGESVFDFAEFKGRLFAITESRGHLYSSANGSQFTRIFTATNNLGLGIIVFKDHLFPTFTSFTNSTGKGPTLYKSADGNNFGEVTWPPVSDSETCVVYESREFKGKLYTSSYCNNYAKTKIYTSTNGDQWNLLEEFNGLKSYTVVAGDRIYGIVNGSTIVEYDGVNEKVVYQGSVKFHNMVFHAGNLYLITKPCWKVCKESDHATLYRYEFASERLVKLTEFDEPEGIHMFVFKGDLIIGTKDHRANNNGKVYRMTFVEL